MDDILELIDKIKASHTNDDGNLDEFGTFALTLVGISLAQGICKVLLKFKNNSDSKIEGSIDEFS